MGKFKTHLPMHIGSTTHPVVVVKAILHMGSAEDVIHKLNK